MSLYKALVHIEFEIVVEADTEEDAMKLVRNHAKDEMDQYSFSYIMEPTHPTKVSDKREVEKEWLSGIPYGHKKGMTVKEILEEESNA